MTARFWMVLNGSDVKVTLRDGQTVQHVSGGPCDEGWAQSGERLTLDGDTVIRETWSDGADCDGRLFVGQTLYCRVDALDAHEYEWAGVKCRAPKWEEEENYRRDYSAEAMGY